MRGGLRYKKKGTAVPPENIYRRKYVLKIGGIRTRTMARKHILAGSACKLQLCAAHGIHRLAPINAEDLFRGSDPAAGLPTTSAAPNCKVLVAI